MADQYQHYLVFAFSVLKDQWIRAKYERREFTGENNYHQQSYSLGKYAYVHISKICTILKPAQTLFLCTS